MSLKSQSKIDAEMPAWKAFAGALRRLLTGYGLRVETVTDDSDIPGSFWGDSEAGLVGNRLYLRDDTPLHSALHEACHFICMDHTRRADLDTNAGGDYDEENVVCYLQAILADAIDGYGRQQLFSDMDAWGYSFRLGSAQAWFESDAEDARTWLVRHGIIDQRQQLTGQLRQQ